MEGGCALGEAADADLLAAAARGDRQAFARLYERHATLVWRYCLARLRDREAAAEACQETFAAVWRAAATYAGSGAVAAWMLGIARRKVADQRRAAARRPVPVPPELWPEGSDPGYAGAVEEALDVWTALGRLPPGQQEAILLTYGLGLSCDDAGQVMGIPAGTVKSRLHAARAALGRDLGGVRG